MVAEGDLELVMLLLLLPECSDSRLVPPYQDNVVLGTELELHTCAVTMHSATAAVKTFKPQLSLDLDHGKA